MDKILKAGQSNIPQDLPGDIYASAFRTSAIGVAVPSVLEAFISRYNEIMAGKYKDELVKDCDASQLIKELKNIGQQHVYCTSSNLKLELMGRRIICDLMDLFWEGAIELPLDDQQINTKGFAGTVGALLSDNYRRVFLNSLKELPELPENYHRLQLVNDYVCGMTDAFAKRLHSELMNG